MSATLKSREIKPINLVEITTAIPQDQLNTLRKMIIGYIMANNKEEIAYKLLDLTNTRLRDDVKLFDRPLV